MVLSQAQETLLWQESRYIAKVMVECAANELELNVRKAETREQVPSFLLVSNVYC